MSILEFYDGRTGGYMETLILPARKVLSIADLNRIDFKVPAIQRDSWDFMTPGNIVICKDELGIFPDVEGIISDDQSWADSKIVVSAFSPKILFTWRDARVMGIEGKELKGSSSLLLEQVINYANGPEDLLIRPGDIEVGEKDQVETLSLDLLGHINAIVGTDYEWRIRYAVDENDAIFFYLDFSKRIGEDTPDITFEEGVNFEKAIGQATLSQNGPIVNQYTALNSGSSPADTIRSTKDDKASIEKYGLRQAADVYMDISEIATLDKKSLAYIANAKTPRNTPAFTLLNNRDLFQKIRLGNTYSCQYKTAGITNGNIGMSEYVRLMTIDHDDVTPNKMLVSCVVEPTVDVD